jgi:hypothetical protein
MAWMAARSQAAQQQPMATDITFDFQGMACGTYFLRVQDGTTGGGCAQSRDPLIGTYE